MLKCPLCQNLVAAFHRRSHLIPEWMYSDCYDEKHKALEISRIRKKVTKRQQGIYDSFICEFCEKETQKYDRYASLILTNKSPKSMENTSVQRKYFNKKVGYEILRYGKWENLDFIKFQKFVLSVILRTHFAGKIEGPVSLSEKHCKKILSIYKNNSSQDDSSYPILVNEYPPDDKLRNHVTLPYINKHEGHHIIEFGGAGYLFNVYLSSHSKPECVNSLRLKKDGSIYLIVMYFEETGLYEKTKKLMRNLNKREK